MYEETDAQHFWGRLWNHSNWNPLAIMNIKNKKLVVFAPWALSQLEQIFLDKDVLRLSTG